MKFDEVREKTKQSDEKLELAQELILKALKLPEGDSERKRLEEQIQKLKNEARQLTETAKKEVSKYR